MAAALLRKSSSQSGAAARVAWTAAVHRDSESCLHCGEQASELAALAGSSRLAFLPRRLSRVLLSRSLWTSSVRFQQRESSGGEGFSASGSLTAPSSQVSLSLEEFRSLLGRKKTEVAILEAALDLLETAPRDRGFEALLRKHNLRIEPKKSVFGGVIERNVGGSNGGANLPLQSRDSISPRSVGPTAREPLKSADEIFGRYSGEPFKATDPIFQRRATAEPVKTAESTLNSVSVPDSGLNTLPPPTMFGKLNLKDFPAPKDPSLERLQKKRRRLELLKEYERKNNIDSMSVGRNGIPSVPRIVPPPTANLAKPNAGAFEDKPEKTYRSLADRLYEEQFGHPAPPGLKRTYPKGSFYDKCMKEKERKEREAAATAAAAARGQIESSSDESPVPIKSDSLLTEGTNDSSTESIVPTNVVIEEITTKTTVFSNDVNEIAATETTFSSNDVNEFSATEAAISSNDGNGFSSTETTVSSNDVNGERKTGAWRCPECTFFNLAADNFCYKCQAQREPTERRSAMG